MKQIIQLAQGHGSSLCCYIQASEWPSLPHQTCTFPSSTFILRPFWLQLLYENILEHHMAPRPVFIDIYGGARIFP